MHALQQRAVGDSGRGEDAVALGEIVERVDAVEVVDAPAPRAADLVLYAASIMITIPSIALFG